MIELDQLWVRLADAEGAVFTHPMGAEFTFRVSEENLEVVNQGFVIPSAHFDRALQLVPLANIRQLQKLAHPAYIYAILSDDRVRRRDW